MINKNAEVLSPQPPHSRGQSHNIDIVQLKKQDFNAKFGMSHDFPFQVGPF
jgi:hypothetical protein